MDFWYDGQLRRYWLQFGRIFTNFQYESGVGANGTKTLRSFPVSMSIKNRQVGHILKNNSENTMLSTPRITFEMVDIQPSAPRRQNPSHVSSANIYERAIDRTTGKYTAELGNTYTVERYMPVPYDMTMKVNIWTYNETQKHQFMEQALVLFNPTIDIQTGDNPIDWTSLTVVELDSISWSNRDLPIGTDDEIEISTLTFKVPIWITPPAKIKKQNIINQIVVSIMEMDESQAANEVGSYNFSEKDLYSRLIVTPGNHQSRVEVNLDSNGAPYFEITLLNQDGLEEDEEGEVYDWRALLNRYGQYRQAVSQFRLSTTDNIEDTDQDVIGIFDFHPSEKNKILWTPDMDTLPGNTIRPINAMISLNNGAHPGNGILPEATPGQRYLLADDLQPSESWTNLQADMNDIIEFDGTNWVIDFDASTHHDKEIVLNTRSGKQLKWTGEMWVDAISADYYPGFWRIFL
jgi:hypothetical protein